MIIVLEDAMFGDVFGGRVASPVGGGGVALIVAGVLIAAGSMMWRSGSPALRASRGARTVGRSRRPAARTWGRALVQAAIGTGVIAGAQWASLRPTGPVWASVLVLGLPAFLAAATVVRLLAVLRAARVRRRDRTDRSSDDATVTPSRTGSDRTGGDQ